MDPYREKIILSYLCIRTSQEDLMDRIVNVGMAGEYKEIGKSFSVDDTYEFDILQFRNTEDVSLNTLVRLFDELEAAKDTIRNIHALTDSEIASLLPEWLAILGVDQDDEDDDLDDYNDLEDFENWEDSEDWDD